jgi:glycerophosphoryl diester phosphodiesterase
LLDYAAENNMKVIPWTVNEKDDMKDLIEKGVDGIITDYPDRAMEVLGR